MAVSVERQEGPLPLSHFIGYQMLVTGPLFFLKNIIIISDYPYSDPAIRAGQGISFADIFRTHEYHLFIALSLPKCDTTHSHSLSARN